MSDSSGHGGNIFRTARQLGTTPEDLTDFSASINPLGISPEVRKALIGALDSIVHYPDSSHTELKQALAGYHNLSPGNFSIANGSTELIYNLPEILNGSRALIISPAFSEYERALHRHNWEMQHFILKPEQDFAIDTGRLGAVLSEGFDALFLCNPGNPAGTLYPLSTIQEILHLCIDSGTFLVLDEAFMDFCEEASAKQFLVHHDNGVILRSMTKFFGFPGLRLGYSISNAAMAEDLDTRGAPWNVNSLAMAAGISALTDAEHNRATRDFIRQERSVFSENLSSLRNVRVYPSSTNFLLAEITDGISVPELQEYLLHQHILIRNCSNFRGLSDRFFRVAVRTKEQNTRLFEHIKRVIT